MSRRGDISNPVLLGLGIAALTVVPGWLALRPDLPASFQAPGSATLQSMAIVGALLLLVPLAYAAAKRSPSTHGHALWCSVHAVAALAGTVLVTVHTAGRLLEPPALLLANLLALMTLGLWARTRGARQMADTFATKQGAFAPAAPANRERLRILIAEKRRLLASLDGAADEAVFSLTLAHWLARPRLARRYARLVREEMRLMDQRASVGTAQAWWRALHLALAWVFFAGLAAHVISVVFFAGWVADGEEVNWWHVARWGS